MTALVGVILSVTVTFFGFVEGKDGKRHRIEQYGVSPSGRKVIYLAEGGGISGKDWRIILREYDEAGGWHEKEVCGSSLEMLMGSGERQRQVLRGDWIDYARNFWWLDEDRVLFWMEWTEGQKDKRGLMLYDGKGLRVVVLGGGSFFTVYGNKVSRRAPWSVFELTEDGRVENYRELRGLEAPGRSPIDQVIVGDRVYFTASRPPAPGCEREAGYRNMLCSYRLTDGIVDTVTIVDGTLLDTQQPGLAIYATTSHQQVGDWHSVMGCYELARGLPELLVIDGEGNGYWLKSPHEEEVEGEEIFVGSAVISPDGNHIFVSLHSCYGGDGVVLWDKFYIVDWQRNEWREVSVPTREFNLWCPTHWCENGIWWATTNEPRTIALVRGIEGVSE